MEGNSQGVAWRITAVHDDTRFVPNQGVERMKRVHYVLEDGNGSHVVIAEKDFSTDKVQKLVGAAATELAAVLTMSGTIPFQDIVGKYGESERGY